MNASTTPEQTAVATAEPINYDEALAYLGGPLMDSLKADGLNVTVRHRSLIVAYLATTMTLAEVNVTSENKGMTISVRWHAGYKRRPGVYEFIGHRINLSGLLTAMQRETKRFTEELASEQRMFAAQAERERIGMLNRPIADTLTKLYGTPCKVAGVGDGDMHEQMGIEYIVPFLVAGEVEPSQNTEGNVCFALRSNIIDTTPELARHLFSALADIEAAKLAAKPAV